MIDYPVTASLPTANPVSDYIFLSINQVELPKGTTNDNKELTEISIANAKNEMTVIVYQKKTELDVIDFSVGFLQINIGQAKKHNLPNDNKITFFGR